MLYTNATNNTVAVGKSARLHCMTNSIPTTNTFLFHHNGSLLAETSNGVLDIDDVQLSNAGLISCYPRNILGQGEPAYVNLTVTHKGSKIFNHEYLES